MNGNNLIRAFIAIDLTAQIKNELARVLKLLKAASPDLPVRWVAVENIHLTLKFLGDVSPANLETIKKMLAAQVETSQPFEIGLGSLGAFPNLKRPRVILVSVKAPATLALYQGNIESATARLGIPRDERPFTPHLTLGRVGRTASNLDVQSIGQVVESVQVHTPGSMVVDAVHLYRSNLRPGGAEYIRLYTASLKQANLEQASMLKD